MLTQGNKNGPSFQAINNAFRPPKQESAEFNQESEKFANSEFPLIAGNGQDSLNVTPEYDKPGFHNLKYTPIFPSQKQPIQPKLKIGPPNDKYEQEADRIADQVMRMPQPDIITSLSIKPKNIQRKCASCEQEEEEELQLKPIASTISPLIQRHIKSESTLSPKTETNLKSLDQGKPLKKSERQFFEPRFGTDFSNVRIHDDHRAAHISNEIGARAFTQGYNIYFNRGEYAPETLEGKRLLGHELTHIVQQNGSRENIQRRVRHMSTIRENLSTGFLNWITDEEASEVLALLDPLNDQDLRDTVARMEQEGLVDRLFEEASEDDRLTYDQSGLFQRIQDNRVYQTDTGGTQRGSCNPDQRNTIISKLIRVGNWAEIARDRVNMFIRNRGEGPVAERVNHLLDRFFFHQEHNASLPLARRLSFAEQIRDNFNALTVLRSHAQVLRGRSIANPPQNQLEIFCANPHDQGCNSGTAAYVPFNTRRVYFCQDVFENEDLEMTALIFHELIHAFTDVNDTGYEWERIIDYLAPEDAIDNADTYTLFTLHILGHGNASWIGSPDVDEISDCSEEEIEILRHRMAYGQRLMDLAKTLINSSHPRNEAGGAAERHFKTYGAVNLRRFATRMGEIKSKLNRPLNFECENSCDTGDIGYYRHPFGDTVHICPAFFNISSENEQVDRLMVMAIMERLELSHNLPPSNPSYTSQSEDDAYNNPDAYVAYARDSIENTRFSPSLQSDERYERRVIRQLEDRFIRTRNQLTESITDPFDQIDHGGQRLVQQIERRFNDLILTEISQQVNASPPQNEAQVTSAMAQHQGMIDRYNLVVTRIVQTFNHETLDVDISRLLADRSLWSSMRTINNLLKAELVNGLIDLIDEQAEQTVSGQPEPPENWPQLNDLITQYHTHVELGNTYAMNYPSYELSTSFIQEAERRAQGLPQFERSAFLQQAEDIHLDLEIIFMTMQSRISQMIIAGTEYDPDDGSINPDIPVRDAYQRLNEIPTSQPISNP